MKKIDRVLDHIDRIIEKRISPLWKFVQKYFVIFSSTLLAFLLLIFFLKIYQDTSSVRVSVMREDLEVLQQILNRIDKECNILNVRSKGADLDFFTVEKFTGSNVGCLNLAYPKNWRGPYLQQDPTMDGRFYEILRARDGYFIVPGQGVRLPNGLVMGKDVMLSDQVRLEDLLKSGGVLNYNGQALGMKLNFKIGDWDSRPPVIDKTKAPTEKFEKTSKMIQEFKEALPYTQRHATENETKAG
jgi:hypothetical protein